MSDTPTLGCETEEWAIHLAYAEAYDCLSHYATVPYRLAYCMFRRGIAYERKRQESSPVISGVETDTSDATGQQEAGE